MTDIKEVAEIVTKTANYYQIPIEEVLQWIKDNIIDIPNQYCFHYEVKTDSKNNMKSCEKVTALKLLPLRRL